MNNPSNANSLKVAAVARRAGVSVRTLHYYEEIDLLSPSARTASGHRLYTHKEIQRLQQIRSLQQLGMGLAEIAECFAAGRIDRRQVVRDHLKRVENEIEDLEQLRTRLHKVASLLDGGGHEDVSSTETFLKALETIAMLDKYFTPEQQLRLKDHQAAGAGSVTPVLEALQTAMDEGVAAESARAGLLVQRWNEALDEVSGGDEAMIQSIQQMLHEEPTAREEHGISEPLFSYMGEVLAAAHHA